MSASKLFDLLLWTYFGLLLCLPYGAPDAAIGIEYPFQYSVWFPLALSFDGRVCCVSVNVPISLSPSFIVMAMAFNQIATLDGSSGAHSRIEWKWCVPCASAQLDAIYTKYNPIYLSLTHTHTYGMLACSLFVHLGFDSAYAGCMLFCSSVETHWLWHNDTIQSMPNACRVCHRT